MAQLPFTEFFVELQCAFNVMVLNKTIVTNHQLVAVLDLYKVDPSFFVIQ